MARGQTLLVFSATDWNPLPTLVSDGASMVITVSGAFNGQWELNGGPITFTTPGTYTVVFPRLSERISIKGVGGGGGGGNGVTDSVHNPGGGGGGGGAANVAGLTFAIAETTSYQVTVGAGGLQLLPGGTTEFKATGGSVHLQLPGGQPGKQISGSGNVDVGGDGGAGGAVGIGLANVAGYPGATGGSVHSDGATALEYVYGAAGGGGGGGSNQGDSSRANHGGVGGDGKDQPGGAGGRSADNQGDNFFPAGTGATASGAGGVGGTGLLGAGGGGGGGGVAFPGVGGFYGGGGGGGGGSKNNSGAGGAGGGGVLQIAKWAILPAKGLWVVGDGHPVVRFGANLSQGAMFPAVMPRQYAGGNLEITLMWSAQYYMGCVWGVAAERHYANYYLGWRTFQPRAAVYVESNKTVPWGANYTTMVIGPPVQPGEHFRLFVQADPYGTDVYLHSIEVREARF